MNWSCRLLICFGLTVALTGLFFGLGDVKFTQWLGCFQRRALLFVLLR